MRKIVDYRVIKLSKRIYSGSLEDTNLSAYSFIPKDYHLHLEVLSYTKNDNKHMDMEINRYVQVHEFYVKIPVFEGEESLIEDGAVF